MIAVIVYHTDSLFLAQNLVNALQAEFEGIEARVAAPAGQKPAYNILVSPKKDGSLEGYAARVLNYWCRGFAAGRKS